MNKILGFNIYSFICGVTFALMLCGLIYFGSRGLKDFDPALRGFALTTVLGAFALGYRLFTWLQRPPSRVYFNRGLKLFWRYPYILFKSGSKKLGAQTFIKKRSYYRWIMHLCLSGGCTLAFAVTFPLVFGWIHFDVDTADTVYYVKVLVLQ